MANPDNSSNTAIVAILVIVILLLGLLYFTGVLGPRESSSGGQTNVNVESPRGTDRSSVIDRSNERSSTDRSSTNKPSETERSSTTQERTSHSSS